MPGVVSGVSEYCDIRCHALRWACMLIGEPMTYPEALEAARWRWPDVEVCR